MWRSAQPSRLHLERQPLEGKQLSRRFGIEFHSCDLGGPSENGISPGGGILWCRQDDFIWRYANVLKALAVLHDQIGLRNRKPIVNLRPQPVSERVYLRFHNTPRA